MLGPGDYGLLAFGLAIGTIASTLVASAPRGLSRFLSGYAADQHDQDLYFTNWLVVVSVTLVLSFVSLVPIIALSGLRGWIAPAIAANLLGVAVFETYREAQRGLSRFGLIIACYLTGNSLQLLGILVAGALGWRAPALFLAIYGLSSCASCLIVNRAAPLTVHFQRDYFSWTTFRKVARLARILIFQTIFYAVWFGADVILVTHLMGTAATGNYAAAKALVAIILLGPFAVATIIGPRVVLLTTQALRVQVLKATLFAGALTLPIAATLVYFSPVFIRIAFGARYLGARGPVAFLALGMSLYAIHLVLESVWIGLGQVQVTALASGTGMAVTVLLGFILISKLGLDGAALAFAAGAMIQLAVIGSFTIWKLNHGPVPSSFKTSSYF
jgi:O-antigen/teichoic acid export membrane protein